MRKVKTVCTPENLKIGHAVLQEIARTKNRRSGTACRMLNELAYHFGPIDSAGVPRVEAYERRNPSMNFREDVEPLPRD